MAADPVTDAVGHGAPGLVLSIAGLLAWGTARGIGKIVVAHEAFAHSVRIVASFGGSPAFPAVRLAVTVAVISAASPYVARPTRVFGWTLVLGLRTQDRPLRSLASNRSSTRRTSCSRHVKRARAFRRHCRERRFSCSTARSAAGERHIAFGAASGESDDLLMQIFGRTSLPCDVPAFVHGDLDADHVIVDADGPWFVSFDAAASTGKAERMTNRICNSREPRSIRSVRSRPWRVPWSRWTRRGKRPSHRAGPARWRRSTPRAGTARTGRTVRPPTAAPR